MMRSLGPLLQKGQRRPSRTIRSPHALHMRCPHATSTYELGLVLQMVHIAALWDTPKEPVLVDAPATLERERRRLGAIWRDG